ncbi:MAG: hypothetical protein DME86_04720 [Verrucomicrobia bacterium]|nr:MAG: hypothetical protein DME86_04720 [Verrucomicrobiota bacterium]
MSDTLQHLKPFTLTAMRKLKRALTNDHKDCKLIKLNPADPTSPYAVMQEGYDSADPTCRMRMFYLQRDGQWIDEIARSAKGVRRMAGAKTF